MTKNQLSFNRCVCVTTFPSGLCTTAINALQIQHSSGQSTQEPEQEERDQMLQKDNPQSQPESGDNEAITLYWNIE